jgi:quercetin dioxygenase-like cupin family protein
MPEPIVVNAKEVVSIQLDDRGRRNAQLFHQTIGNQEVIISYGEWNPGASNGPHTRTTPELLLAVHGKGEVIVEGGPTHTMEPYTLIYIPPGVTHTHRNATNGVYIQISIQADGPIA